MSDEHTPGPWAVGAWIGTCNRNHKHDRSRFSTDPCVYDYVFDATRLHCVSAACLEVHREFIGMEGDIAINNNQADVRLIAAAPELLDALRRCLCALEGRQHPDEKAEDYRDNCIDVATDAIKKATGESL